MQSSRITQIRVSIIKLFESILIMTSEHSLKIIMLTDFPPNLQLQAALHSLLPTMMLMKVKKVLLCVL